MLQASIERVIQLDGSYTLAGLNGRATVLATATNEVVLVRADGLRRAWSTDSQILGCALSEDDRVAILETRPTAEGRWPTCIRIATIESDAEIRLDAHLPDDLVFHYGTGGAITWADERSVWIAGSDEGSKGLWVGRLDLDSRAVHGSSFRDPYAESWMRFAPGATRRRVSFDLDAGQHGGWPHVATIGERVVVERLAPSAHTVGHFETDDGAVVVLDGYDVVRWSADRAARDALALDVSSFPIALAPAPGGRAIVQCQRGEIIAIDVRAMQAIGPVSLGMPVRSESPLVARSGRFVSELAVERGSSTTRLALWSLPDDVVDATAPSR